MRRINNEELVINNEEKMVERYNSETCYYTFRSESIIARWLIGVSCSFGSVVGGAGE
jgi:hypothetical protein